MYHKREKKQLSFYTLRTCLLLLMLTAAFLSSRDESGYTAFASVKQISFQNDMVKAGVPLTVMGAPKNAVFQWDIKGADGSVKTFTTEKNSYIPKENDMEKLITVSVKGLKGVSASIYYSTLPVIYINNAEGYYGVGDDYSDAVIKLQGNEKHSDKNEFYSGGISIKLRGNSTKNRDKRPFNIKLDKKADLLGLGSNKHWALLANDIDHTLMRNKLLYDFSGAIGMKYYCKSENTVLIFNDEYYGVYQLSELVDLGKSRVNIYDWEDTAGKTAKAITDEAVKQGKISKEYASKTTESLKNAMCEDLSWITSPYTFSYDVNEDGKKETYTVTDYSKLPGAAGGALMEMDFFAFEGKNASTMISAYSMPWYFKSPEYAVTNPSFYNYINSYVQSFEYALHSSDFTYHDKAEKYTAENRSGGSENAGYIKSGFTAPEYDDKHYSELFDMDSLVQNFLVCEYSMNWDSMKNSVFMYKDIDGLFFMGPEWDFDWAWGNINMFDTNTWYPENWQTTSNIFAREQFYQTVQWNRCLIRDPYFLVRVYEKYKKIRPTIIEDMIKDGGTIDTYAKELKTPAAANDAKWSYSYSQYKSVGFQESVKNMKEFLKLRVSWLDQQFESLDTLVPSLGYYSSDSDMKITKIDTTSEKKYALVTVQVIGPEIASVTFQVNGTHRYTEEISSGRAVCRIPKSALETGKDVLNVVQVLALDRQGQYIIASSEKGNYSLAKSNYTVFYNNGTGTAGDSSLGSRVKEALGAVRQTRDRKGMYVIAAGILMLALIGTGAWLIIKMHKKSKKKK